MLRRAYHPSEYTEYSVSEYSVSEHSGSERATPRATDRAVCRPAGHRPRTRRRRRRAPLPSNAFDDGDGAVAATPRTRMWDEAASHQASGNFVEANRLYCGLIDAEPDSADLCLYHLGVLAEMQGDYATADNAYGKAEELRLASLGPNGVADQLLLRIRMGIVNVLDELGHSAEAEALCAKVAAGQMRSVGKDHPDTLRTLMSMANIVAARGQHEQAAVLIKDVEARQVAALGSDHPDVLLTKYNRRCGALVPAQHGLSSNMMALITSDCGGNAMAAASSTTSASTTPQSNSARRCRPSKLLS